MVSKPLKPHRQIIQTVHGIWTTLRSRLGGRFQRIGQMTDLEQAIQYDQQALKAIPADHPDRARYLNNLGSRLVGRFQRTGQMTGLEQAIQYGQQALEAIPADYPDRARYLNNLGSGLESRFQRTGQMTDLEQAIQYGQQALEATPADHPDRARYLSNLGLRFSDRFRRIGQMTDLEQAIQYGRQALKATPADHPDRARYLNNLGLRLGGRFQRIGQMTDLEQAIQYSQQALETTPADHSDRALYLHNLGAEFCDRFKRTGEMTDLEQAIQYNQQALEAIPADHLYRAWYLDSLGSEFIDRFQRTGQMTDLEQAIQYNQQALEATPADHPDRARYLNNLGSRFEGRFQRTGQMTDLEQAIQYGQQALEATPADHPDRAGCLGDLGLRFGGRFQRTGQMTDLEQAIQYDQQALEAIPADHPNRARYLNNLGSGLGGRFLRTGQMTDLEQAIQYNQQALKTTPVDHPDRARYLDNLGLRFGDRFQRIGQMTDLEQAIQYGQQALEATPADHPDRARYLNNLGSKLGDRFQRTHAVADLRGSTEIFKKALSCSSSVALSRIAAGRSAVYNLRIEKKWNDAAHILVKILHLLPEVTPPTNSRDDLQHTLQQLSGLASSAASIFLKAGKPAVKALQALESGRGIIASLMIDARSDASMLKEKYPELWSRYAECRERIAATSTESSFTLDTTLSQDYIRRSENRQQVFSTLDDLRNEIRKCPGFERFLLPPIETEIRGLARNGPIVCFNVSNVSSEAFLVTMKSIQALSLPDLKLENIQSCVRLFALRGNPSRRDATIWESDKDEQCFTPNMSTELRSLWTNAVKLVLQQLGLFGQKKSPDTLPRIYWVGGGMMALLPLHAAGDHTPGSTENTISHVISSFVPTLKALQFVQNKPPFSIRERRPKILIVSMPTTPGGYKPLKVSEEVAAITSHTRSWASTTALEQPSRESVLNILKSCSIAHFVCHGLADPVEPAKSALILGRELEQRLSLKDLDAITHDNAQIAYLSACSTAESKVQNLVDESIHLASTFQLAGFQHVIGTLWGADDSAAVEIAGKFYEGLLQHTTDDGTSVAGALHDAVLCYRNAKGNCADVSKWAPFIHLGC
jgi:tetratricopeptide (TPR) repeat protein